MKDVSLILKADGYKFSHWEQLPCDTEGMHGYIESRGGLYDETVVLGYQYIILNSLLKPLTQEDVDYAHSRVIGQSYGTNFNYKGWTDLVTKYKGHYPLKIRAVPEGTIMKGKNVMVTVQTTDPDFAWLESYVETILMRLWYATTVATTSNTIYTILEYYLKETANDTSEIDYKLHDFGARACTCDEQAAIGGAAHLSVFKGTDTFIANEFITEVYGYGPLAGTSIDASEHSTITIWTKAGEAAAYKNMKEKYKGKMFACVIDSYDPLNAIRLWAEHKDELLADGSVIVFRPDSGTPWEMVVLVAQEIEKYWGFFYNKRGYKEFTGAKIIYGDGMSSPSDIRKCLQALHNNEYSANIVAFGMGGGLLQKVDRDTLQFAMKCSAAKVGGKHIEVYKEPIHAPNKKSKRGYLDLIQDIHGNFQTVESETPMEVMGTCLKTVYENGKISNFSTFPEIRERIKFYRNK